VFALIAFLASFVIILLYFKIADKFNIIDKPNNRSSHTQITIRGAGIVFPLMIVTVWLFGRQMGLLPDLIESYNLSKIQNVEFYLGLSIIAVISFWDDVKPLPPKIRMLVHAVAVSLITIPLGADWWIVAVAMVLIIGTINAYNFMDGINGITALYSLVAVGTALTMLGMGYDLVLGESIWLTLGASLVAFSFFNVRKKARCFMGDVGAVSLAFVLAYWIYGLVLSQENLIYILFLGVYGLDSVATIAIRIYKKENIFEAHRSHFYQYLANEKAWPHVAVSSLYAAIQVVLNALILWQPLVGVLFFVFLVFAYIKIRLPQLRSNPS